MPSSTDLTRSRGASDVLQARYELERQLSAARSVSGAVEDKLRLGARGARDGASGDGIERLRLAYLDALALCRDLTAEEESICRLRYTGTLGTSDPARLVPALRPQLEVYERSCSSADVQVVRSIEGHPPELRTEEGEVLIGPAQDAAGQPVAGRSLVRGQRARLHTYEEISEAMGTLTPRQVQARIHSACSKVRLALIERSHRQSLDSE